METLETFVSRFPILPETQFAFSGNGVYFACVVFGRYVYRCDTINSTIRIISLPLITTPQSIIAVSDDGKHVAAVIEKILYIVSADGTGHVQYYKHEDDQHIRSITFHGDAVYALMMKGYSGLYLTRYAMDCSGATDSSKCQYSAIEKVLSYNGKLHFSMYGMVAALTIAPFIRVGNPYIIPRNGKCDPPIYLQQTEQSREYGWVSELHSVAVVTNGCKIRIVR